MNLIVLFQSFYLNIKNYLLDQKFVSGLGNIYVNEVLFLSSVKPTKKTHLIEDIEIKTNFGVYADKVGAGKTLVMSTLICENENFFFILLIISAC